VSVHTSKPGSPRAAPKGENPFAVVLHPAPGQWLTGMRASPLTEAQRHFRSQLGLPVESRSARDPLVIMSGHQAEFWHPGIFAKAAAAQALADALNARGAAACTSWLVVDQDTNEPHKLRYPALGPRGELIAREWTIDPAPVLGETPTGMRPPLGASKSLSPVPSDTADASLASRLAHLRDLLAAQTTAPSAAAQISIVLQSLLAPAVSMPAPTFASAISSTDLFALVLDKVSADPIACTRAYNAAARAYPLSGIRPLDETRGELPLWHVRPNEPRRRVLASALAKIPRTELAPRALLMTGLMRLAGCDLFIHGIGGGGLDENSGYDHVTDQWFKAWLATQLAEWSSGGLAPAVTASATLRLELPGPDAPSQDAIAHAQWLAHAARHQPGLLGDAQAQRQRDEALARIRTARARGEQPLAAFRELHALLHQQRESHAAKLAALQADAAAFKARSAESLIRHDRTWSVALHSQTRLHELAESVAAHVGAVAP